MKSLISACILLSYLAVARARPPHVTGNLDDTIKLFSKMVADGKISQVEIIYLPTNVLTRTRVTGAWLEANFRYKLTISEISGSRKAEGLCKLITGMTTKPSPEAPDLRWGCIFKDRTGAKLFSVFLDAAGGSGVVQETPAQLDGRLRAWLEANIAAVFH